MSTRHESYIIAGKRLNHKQFSKDLDENYEVMDKLQFPWCGKGAKGTFGVLSECMGADDYTIAGYCIDCGEEFNGLSLNELDEHDIIKHIQPVSDWLYQNNLLKYIEGDFKLFVLTHWH